MPAIQTPPRSSREMFAAYRAHRLRGESPQESIQRTLRQFNRENRGQQTEEITRNLLADEARFGLRDEPEPQPEPEPEPHPDLVALERDADRRVVELREQRQRLAPEALVDDAVKQELLAVESELTEAERASELAPLARQERERRQREARENEREREREAAFARGRELEAERVRRAAAVDKSARALMKTLAAYRKIATEQQQALRRAGLDAQQHRPERVLAAIRRAMLDEGVPAAAFAGVFGPLWDSDRPLAESEPAREL